MAKSGKKKNRRGLGIIAITVIVLFAILSFSGKGLKEQRAALQVKYEEDKTRLSNEHRRSVELKDKLSSMESDKNIEDVAREKLGLVYPGEIIFRPED